MPSPQSNNTPNGEGVKTLGIKLLGAQHAQLSTIAQLQGLTMIDAIREAIDEWVEARRDNPELKARAEALLDEIEHEANTRRGAVAALIGKAGSGTAPKGAAPTPEKQPSTRRKEPMGFAPNRSAAPRGKETATS